MSDDPGAARTPEERPRPRSLRSRLLRAGIAIAVIGTVASFFSRALMRNWDSLREQDLSLGWWALGVVVLFVVAVVVSGALWGAIVRTLDDRPLSAVEAIRVHAASWLLKYVPGQVGFVVNKLMWGRRRGTSRLLVLISVAYANVFLLVGSLVPMLAILLVARGGDGVPSAVWWAVAATVPMLAVAHPAVSHRLVNRLARRRLGQDVPESALLSLGATWRFQLLYLLPRLTNGIGVVVIAVALADAEAASWVPLVAAYAVAGAVGILAVFVPSGLGVREAVFVAFAAPYLGVDQAIVVSLVARVLATAADAVLGAGYGALTMRRDRKAVET